MWSWFHRLGARTGNCRDVVEWQLSLAVREQLIGRQGLRLDHVLGVDWTRSGHSSVLSTRVLDQTNLDQNLDQNLVRSRVGGAFLSKEK